MSAAYGQPDSHAGMRTIQAALGLGITFFDTADVYGGHSANERLVGQALAAVRDQVVIATKFGIEINDAGQKVGINGTPEYVRACCDRSLTALGTDYIDLYYQHRVDPDVPIEETWGALAELVTEGKVRALGISEAAPETIRRAHAVHPISAVQSEWSLWTRDVERNGVLQATRELGIGFVPFSPLGRGFFAGSITSREQLQDGDMRRSNPRFAEEHLQTNLQLVRQIAAIAAELGISTTQLALAWLLAQGDDVVPIPGTKRVEYLLDNAGASDVRLSADVLEAIDRATAPEAVAGDRYYDMSEVYR